MKIEIPKCPTCGGPAIGTLETVQAIAKLGEIKEDGTCEYEGTTEILWDTQKTMLVLHTPVLVCAQHHDWASTITESELNT